MNVILFNLAILLTFALSSTSHAQTCERLFAERSFNNLYSALAPARLNVTGQFESNIGILEKAERFSVFYKDLEAAANAITTFVGVSYSIANETTQSRLAHLKYLFDKYDDSGTGYGRNEAQSVSNMLSKVFESDTTSSDSVSNSITRLETIKRLLPLMYTNEFREHEGTMSRDMLTENHFTGTLRLQIANIFARQGHDKLAIAIYAWELQRATSFEQALKYTSTIVSNLNRYFSEYYKSVIFLNKFLFPYLQSRFEMTYEQMSQKLSESEIYNARDIMRYLEEARQEELIDLVTNSNSIASLDAQNLVNALLMVFSNKSSNNPYNNLYKRRLREFLIAHKEIFDDPLVAQTLLFSKDIETWVLEEVLNAP